eukprot:4214761-Amphidinium_carterae.4
MESYMVNLLKTTWQNGYETNSHHLTTLPNGLGCFKLLISGQITWALFELASLVSALKVRLCKDEISIDEVLDSVKHMSDKDIAELFAQGCHVKHVVQNSGELLYVPAAHIAAERASTGVLIYGLRKTVIYQSETAVMGYQALIGCNQCAGKAVDELNATCALIAPDE